MEGREVRRERGGRAGEPEGGRGVCGGARGAGDSPTPPGTGLLPKDGLCVVMTTAVAFRVITCE